MEENAKLVESVSVSPPGAVLPAKVIHVSLMTLAVRVGPAGLVGPAPASLDSVEPHVKQVWMCIGGAGPHNVVPIASFAVNFM